MSLTLDNKTAHSALKTDSVSLDLVKYHSSKIRQSPSDNVIVLQGPMSESKVAYILRASSRSNRGVVTADCLTSVRKALLLDEIVFLLFTCALALAYPVSVFSLAIGNQMRWAASAAPAFGSLAVAVAIPTLYSFVNSLGYLWFWCYHYCNFRFSPTLLPLDKRWMYAYFECPVHPTQPLSQEQTQEVPRRAGACFAGWCSFGLLLLLGLILAGSIVASDSIGSTMAQFSFMLGYVGVKACGIGFLVLGACALLCRCQGGELLFFVGIPAALFFISLHFRAAGAVTLGGEFLSVLSLVGFAIELILGSIFAPAWVMTQNGSVKMATFSAIQFCMPALALILTAADGLSWVAAFSPALISSITLPLVIPHYIQSSLQEFNQEVIKYVSLTNTSTILAAQNSIVGAQDSIERLLKLIKLHQCAQFNIIAKALANFSR